MRLQGKRALVTGAASAAGIGFATARRLARDGARVLLTDIDADGVAARASELRAEGLDAIGCGHDVTSEESWTSAIAAIYGDFGGIDILVNNAGIVILERIEAMSSESWGRQMDVNVKSVFLGCQAALVAMRAQGTGGAIVNLSSIAGVIGMANTTAYTASKAGVRMMTKAIAMETAAEGIRINAVMPGVVMTDMQKVQLEADPAQADAVKASIPLRRIGQPDDIASMIAFLVSEDASYITAGEFIVDGGFTAQ
jgi:NAD(P)-dependent dehydrogenase (short-subunit alcohol dehydrogenase family)